MKKEFFKKFMSLITFVLSTQIYAQTITGIVTSEDGPLPGAAVILKGTNQGTSTDFDGNFSIQANADAILIVSYVGFVTQEVSVDGQDNITITLETGNELDEIVVTGYGSIVKRDATGAVDAISSDNFDLIAADSPAQLLRGKVAGVQITSSSGEPGAGVSIRVRGNTSVRSGNEPLIVVDGVPLSGGNTQSGISGFGEFQSGSARNPLNFINQNDI
jgi:iron complex outermembrane receptor protein